MAERYKLPDGSERDVELRHWVPSLQIRLVGFTVSGATQWYAESLLTPVKPPTPPEPEPGAWQIGALLAVRIPRVDDEYAHEDGDDWFLPTLGRWMEWEVLWRDLGGPDVTITRLVPERVETVPLPWTGRSQTGLFIFGVTPCRPGGRDAANVSINDAMATITPSVAREMAAALLAFANGTAASRAES